jgi:Flp pilus assembly protein TadG
MTEISIEKQRSPFSHRRRHPQRKGYILVATSLGMMFILGVGGLAIDVGRMYIAKNEAQAYVDSAALAAAAQLDNSLTGITRAQTAVSQTPMKWNLGTTGFSGVTTSFSTSDTGTFVSTPPNPPTAYDFVRVVANIQIPMYLLRPLVGPLSSIAASSVAGRQFLTTFPGGEFPFSPYTRKGYEGASPDDAVDPYGFKVGNSYTLHWGAPGDKSTCGTDKNAPTLATNGNVRGYCCAGSAVDIRGAVVGLGTIPVTIGDPLPMDNATRDNVNTTIGYRVQYDSDSASTSYAQYRSRGTGNRVRVVVVPVNAGPPSYINVGFAAFFLDRPDKYFPLNGNDSACGEYIGAWVPGSSTNTGGSGAYKIRLYQ